MDGRSRAERTEYFSVSPKGSTATTDDPEWPYPPSESKNFTSCFLSHYSGITVVGDLRREDTSDMEPTKFNYQPVVEHTGRIRSSFDWNIHMTKITLGTLGVALQIPVEKVLESGIYEYRLTVFRDFNFYGPRLPEYKLEWLGTLPARSAKLSAGGNIRTESYLVRSPPVSKDLRVAYAHVGDGGQSWAHDWRSVVPDTVYSAEGILDLTIPCDGVEVEVMFADMSLFSGLSMHMHGVYNDRLYIKLPELRLELCSIS